VKEDKELKHEKTLVVISLILTDSNMEC